MLNRMSKTRVLPATEMIADMTGSQEEIGILEFNPVKIIFDNMGTSEVVLYISLDQGNTSIKWKTFAPEEALVIDNDNETFQKGTIFYGNGNVGGKFSIAYLYTNN